jgi:hypothetical protein
MSSEIKNKLFSSQLNTHNSILNTQYSQLSLLVVSIRTWGLYRPSSVTSAPKHWGGTLEKIRDELADYGLEERMR